MLQSLSTNIKIVYEKDDKSLEWIASDQTLFKKLVLSGFSEDIRHSETLLSEEALTFGHGITCSCREGRSKIV